MKIAALLFVLFIVLVILSADAGRMPWFIKIMYDFPNGDRVGHVVLFGILSFLLASAFPRKFRVGSFSLPIATAVLSVLCIAEECSQSLFSTRTFDLVDLTCSFTGISLGTWAAYRWGGARRTP